MSFPEVEAAGRMGSRTNRWRYSRRLLRSTCRLWTEQVALLLLAVRGNGAHQPNLVSAHEYGISVTESEKARGGTYCSIAIDRRRHKCAGGAARLQQILPHARGGGATHYSLETLLTLFRQKNGRVSALLHRCYGLRRRRAINNARKATRSMRVTTGCAGACGDACAGDSGSAWVGVLRALVALAALAAPTASLAAAPAATLDARWAARASLLSTSTRGMCGGRDAPSGCAVPGGGAASCAQGVMA